MTSLKKTLLAPLFCVLSVAAMAAAASADPHERHFGRGAEAREERSYRSGGTFTAPAPREAYEVRHGGHRYWYHHGGWYSARGPRWLVVTPPIGVFVPYLPSIYSTLWWAGVPYYYADDVYYVWRENRNAYEVVPPPQEAQPDEGPADLFIYPRDGQDEARQAEDRYQCHRWASEQTHFDPTRPGGGLSEHAQRGRRDYLRAMSACLEGRGYTVK